MTDIQQTSGSPAGSSAEALTPITIEPVIMRRARARDNHVFMMFCLLFVISMVSTMTWRPRTVGCSPAWNQKLFCPKRIKKQ